MKRMQHVCLALLLLAGLATRALAEVKMPAVFGSRMILQREAKVPLWGTADPGEKIAISFAGQKVAAEAGADGKWKAALEPMHASTRSRTLTVRAQNTLEFEDVLVGDVWICSGQSNMQWSASLGIMDKDKEIAAAKYPRIRMLSVTRTISQTPLENIEGKWAACTPDVMKDFSAVGYFFGRELYRKLDVPIGLIGTNWGGTPAQAWTSHEALAADEHLKKYFNDWDSYMALYPEARKRYDAMMAARQGQAAAPGQVAPRPPEDPEKSPKRPCVLYNGMIAPLVPFAIRGAIWYQGESNAGSPEDAALYHRLFTAMITDWRAQWGQGDFPFLFVQLANFMPRKEQPADSNWAMLRESQLKTLALPNTGMAVIIDAGDEKNIHPQNKQVVGQRLALAALKVAYDRNVEYSGPIFDKMANQRDKIVIGFKNVGEGLVSKAEGGAVKGFAIAGSDKQFVWADARIVGDTVEVSSPQVKDPVAVRYGWADNPEVSLYNAAGLPASPFRTDTWEETGAAAATAAKPVARPAARRQPKTLRPVRK